MKENKARIRKAGLDPDLILDNLQPVIENTKTSNRVQENFKATLKNQTAALVQGDRRMGVLTSSSIDDVSGVSGKDTSESKQFAAEAQQAAQARQDAHPRVTLILGFDTCCGMGPAGRVTFPGGSPFFSMRCGLLTRGFSEQPGLSCGSMRCPPP